jgi:hypothetical protein
MRERGRKRPRRIDAVGEIVEASEALPRRRGVELDLTPRLQIELLQVSGHQHRLGVEVVAGGPEATAQRLVLRAHPDGPRVDPGLDVRGLELVAHGHKRLGIVVDDCVEHRPVGPRGHHCREHATRPLDDGRVRRGPTEHPVQLALSDELAGGEGGVVHGPMVPRPRRALCDDRQARTSGSSSANLPFASLDPASG